MYAGGDGGATLRGAIYIAGRRIYNGPRRNGEEGGRS